MYSEATANLADGFVLKRWLGGVVWRGLGRVGGFWTLWVRFAAGECARGIGAFRDFLGQGRGPGREVWLRFAPARAVELGSEGGGAITAGAASSNAEILGPICRPLSAGNSSKKWLEMEGKSLRNWMALRGFWRVKGAEKDHPRMGANERQSEYAWVASK
jgi:hypothetical protein